MMAFEVPTPLSSCENSVGYYNGNLRAYLESLIVEIGYGPLLREYVYFLLAKLAFHRQHPEFNGTSTS